MNKFELIKTQKEVSEKPNLVKTPLLTIDNLDEMNDERLTFEMEWVRDCFAKYNRERYPIPSANQQQLTTLESLKRMTYQYLSIIF